MKFNIRDSTCKLEGYRQTSVFFWCPGCEYLHRFVIARDHSGPVWVVTGAGDDLTFSPSLLINGSDPKTRCHSFVRGGRIQFLGDCWHSLKGQTIDVPEIPKGYFGDLEDQK